MNISTKEQPQSKLERPYDLKSFRLLIVEDSTFISSLLSSALTAMGVGHITAANNVSSAKEKLLHFNVVPSSQNFDVVIADWLMPDGTGKDFISWMRGHKSSSIKFLPVIVCSAYTNTNLVELCRDSGANEVLVKPVSAEKLSQRILYVIDRPRPYIQSRDFFGPDRRRKVLKVVGEERRKTKPGEVEEDHEQLK